MITLYARDRGKKHIDITKRGREKINKDMRSGLCVTLSENFELVWSKVKGDKRNEECLTSGPRSGHFAQMLTFAYRKTFKLTFQLRAI